MVCLMVLLNLQVSPDIQPFGICRCSWSLGSSFLLIVYIHVHTYTHAHTYMYIHAHVCNTQMYKYMCMHAYVYIHARTYLTVCSPSCTPSLIILLLGSQACVSTPGSNHFLIHEIFYLDLIFPILDLKQHLKREREKERKKGIWLVVS